MRRIGPLTWCNAALGCRKKCIPIIEHKRLFLYAPNPGGHLARQSWNFGARRVNEVEEQSSTQYDYNENPPQEHTQHFLQRRLPAAITSSRESIARNLKGHHSAEIREAGRRVSVGCMQRSQPTLSLKSFGALYEPRQGVLQFRQTQESAPAMSIPRYFRRD